MTKALITLGSTTSHGGIITEVDSKLKINGVAVHLEGMSHVCPTCKTTVTEIASGKTPKLNGRTVILQGDKTSCGASFIACQGSATSTG